MVIEELCVGDWVKVVTYDKRVKPFMSQVHAVDKLTAHGFYPKGTKASYEDEHYGWKVGLGNLSPVEITPEILEKNGFREDKAETYVKSYFFPVDKDNMSVRGFRLEVGKTTFYITDHTLMPIRYVHELQHALRLMGMSEVANNFNID